MKMSRLYIYVLLAALPLSMHAMENQQQALNERLFAAARDGRLEELKNLLKHGADINFVWSRNNLTPLMIAVMGDNLEMVDYLLKAGAQVNQKVDNDTTALMYAASLASPRIVTLLLDHGADMYAINKRANSSLHSAALQPNPTNVKILLQKITQLTPQESNALKNWLCLTKKLQIEQDIHRPPDLRKLIAQQMYLSLAQDLKARVIRAGVLKALIDLGTIAAMHPDKSREVNTLIKQYLNLDFLKQRVKEQINLPQLMAPQEEEQSGWFGECSVQ